MKQQNTHTDTAEALAAETTAEEQQQMSAKTAETPSIWDIEAGLMADPKQRMVSGWENEIQAYVRQVYQYLTLLCAVATAGCVAQIQIGFPMLLSALGALGLLFYVYYTRDRGTTTARVAAFSLFGFCMGITLGPLCNKALHMENGSFLIVTALGLTAGIFACFTLAARYAKRRSYLYMGGFLSTAVLGLLACGLLNMFLALPILRAAQVYGGLIVFSLYIVYDTQMMIEKAHLGARDTLCDALNLFVDLVGVFRRILIILTDRSD